MLKILVSLKAKQKPYMTTPTLNPLVLLAIPLAPLIGSVIAGLFGTQFLAISLVAKHLTPLLFWV